MPSKKSHVQKTAGTARKAPESLHTLSHITAYQDDVSRVIHSNFFRRLEGKSQLFPAGKSDFFRNRLTHSLEVACIGKIIAGKLSRQIPLEVVELAGLCHDIGHPPFGHQGEKALFKLMKKDGGFEGNAQTMRLVARLEKLVMRGNSLYGVDKKSDKRYGLNLTARSLASVLKYDKAIPQKNKKFNKGYYKSEKGLIDWVKLNVTEGKRYRGTFKTIECSIMDVADDIAYSTFDLMDALHAGFIRISDLMSGGSGVSTMDRVAGEVTKTLKREKRLGKNEKIGREKVLDVITGLLSPFLASQGVKIKFNVDMSEISKIQVITQLFAGK